MKTAKLIDILKKEVKMEEYRGILFETKTILDGETFYDEEFPSKVRLASIMVSDNDATYFESEKELTIIWNWEYDGQFFNHKLTFKKR